ncbi:MAG: lipid A biosynthesis acyltransferase [Nitrolancea sp.]
MVTQRNDRLPSLKTRLALRFATTLGRIGEILPVGFGYWLSDRCGDLIFTFSPKYRGNVRANLAHVTGLAENSPEVRKLVRRVFHYSSRNFFDLMRVSHLTDDELRAAVIGSRESWERLDRVREAGKGGIVVSAHFGAFDYTGQAIYSNGYPIIPLTTRTVPVPVYQVVTSLRRSHGLNIEEANSRGIRHVLAAVRRGEFAGLMADRDFFHNGIPVEFFGTMTSLPPGPARIARDTGAPIILVFTKRLSKGYVLTVAEPFHVEKTTDADRDIGLAMARIARCFEREIREHPEQWVMFQRVWPDLGATATQPAIAALENSLRQVMLEPDQPSASPVGSAAGATMPSALGGEPPVGIDLDR